MIAPNRTFLAVCKGRNCPFDLNLRSGLRAAKSGIGAVGREGFASRWSIDGVVIGSWTEGSVFVAGEITSIRAVGAVAPGFGLLGEGLRGRVNPEIRSGPFLAPRQRPRCRRVPFDPCSALRAQIRVSGRRAGSRSLAGSSPLDLRLAPAAASQRPRCRRVPFDPRPALRARIRTTARGDAVGWYLRSSPALSRRSGRVDVSVSAIGLQASGVTPGVRSVMDPDPAVSLTCVSEASSSPTRSRSSAPSKYRTSPSRSCSHAKTLCRI